MKKTFREKITFWEARQKKNHKYLSWLISAVAALGKCGYFVFLSLINNGKKLACAAVVLLFFFVSSSFGYQGQAKTSDVPLDENGLQFAVEDATQIDVDMAQQIEEEDIQEIYADLALLEFEDPDIQTIEDILAGNEEYLQSRDDDAEYGAEGDDVESGDGAERGEVENGGERSEEDAQEQSGDGAETDNAEGDDAESDNTEIPEFDPEDWRLMLVNKQHPMPEDYEITLVRVSGNWKCDKRIYDELKAMMQAAKEDNIDLDIASLYRDYSQQTYLFNKKIDKYLNKGLSYMDAYRVASTIVTAPNASEHQLGLAIDFNCDEHTSLNSGFAKTATGKWLKENCAEYGFILRYPEGKEYITGIIYEPWHFRYVGKEAAQFIMDKGITLEEFWEDYLN